MTNKLSKLTTGSASTSDYPSPVGSSKPSKAQEMEQRRWKAKDAMSCLIRAEEIRRDRQLMADIQVVAAEEQKRLQTIRNRKASGR